MTPFLWYNYTSDRINNQMKAKVGIVGYRGYSGAELVHLLARHPGVETYLLEHREESGPGRRSVARSRPDAFRAIHK